MRDGALLQLLLLASSAPGRHMGSSAVSPSSTWPRCDECEAVGTQIGAHFDRQRKPKRLGGGLRNLTAMDLEEMFPDSICMDEIFKEYTMARDNNGKLRLHGPGITPPKIGLLQVGVGKGTSKLGKMMASLEKNVGMRMATHCEEVAENGAQQRTTHCVYGWRPHDARRSSSIQWGCSSYGGCSST